MTAPQPAHLATVHRGTALEAVIRGHVAVVDRDGALVAWAGDPAAVTTVRSCAKPIQALAMVRDAADVLDVSEGEIAIACSSHGGEPMHVEVVRRLLNRAHLGEDALSCGPQLPMDDIAATAILAAGGSAGRVTNNCSGKHAGMLAACVVRGWATSRYADPGHPLQLAIRATMGEFAGCDLALAPVGVDGCGLRTHGLPLHALARMFAAATADPAFQRCQAAMAAYPQLVAGTGRFDTALLTEAGDHLTAKTGAAGVWVAVLRPAGPAVAVKLEAGDGTALPAVALAALARIGWVDLAAPGLAPFVRPLVRNWEGDAVGSIDVTPGWLDPRAA